MESHTIQNQYPPPVPGAMMTMVPPAAAITGVPRGLEYLTQIDQLIVKQVVTLLESFTAWECRNKFRIQNIAGQEIYYAGEESDVCMRYFCRQGRGFIMHVTDNYGQEVLRVRRQFKLCGGFCWLACSDCFAWEITVEAPVGITIGYIRQTCSVMSPCFAILDENRETILKINGPPYCLMCECPCSDINFTVETPGGVVVGKVAKKWSGLGKEIFTQADNFGITFPMDLDVKVKGTLVGAVFLINMMFFEEPKKDHHDRHDGD